MLTVLAYAVTKNNDIKETFAHEARQIFNKKGIGATVYVHSAPVHTYERIVAKGLKPKDKTNNWVKDIEIPTLREVEKQHGSEIYAIKLYWEAPIHFEFDDFRKKITGHPDIILQNNTHFRQQKNRGHVPFSYDPNKDYYTEVNR